MELNDVFGNRWVQLSVITLFVVLAVLEPLHALIPRWEIVLAVGFIVTWMFGQRYEREIVVEAGLADRQDVMDAERDAAGFLF